MQLGGSVQLLVYFVMVIGMGKSHQQSQDKPVFQLVPDNSPVQSEIDVPKGTAAEDGNYHVLTSVVSNK